MPSKSEAILSSHRDAATRVTKHFSTKHGLSLKPNDALDVVALVLGAANWKTLRAMAEQGRAPRMADLAGDNAVEPQPLHFDPAGVGEGSSPGRTPFPTKSVAVYDIITALENRNKGIQAHPRANWGELAAVAQRQRNLVLTAAQSAAVETFLSRQFSMIKGERGSGKTTAIDVFVDTMRAGGFQVLDTRTSDPVLTMQGAMGLYNGTMTCNAHNPMCIDALVLDERAFDRLDVIGAALDALPAMCRVVLDGDTADYRTKGPAAIFQALRASPRVHWVKLSGVLRQPSILSVPLPPEHQIAGALTQRLKRSVPLPSEWVNKLRDMELALAVKLTATQAVTLDHLASTAASFVVGGDHAGVAVRLFGSAMGQAGYHVYDAIGTGNPEVLLKAMRGQDRLGKQVVSAPIPATADVLLLDERAFSDLALLARVVGNLKADCRVVVHFSKWRPTTETAEAVASIVEILAGLELAPLVFSTDGSMHAAGPSLR